MRFFVCVLVAVAFSVLAFQWGMSRATPAGTGEDDGIFAPPPSDVRPFIFTNGTAKTIRSIKVLMAARGPRLRRLAYSFYDEPIEAGGNRLFMLPDRSCTYLFEVIFADDTAYRPAPIDTCRSASFILQPEEDRIQGRVIARV